MEQRTVDDGRRRGGLNRRGNAAGARDVRPPTPPLSGPLTGPLTGPSTIPLTGIRAASPSGRHRSPWGTSGRILRPRWGRIAAGTLMAVAIVGGLVGFALLSAGGGNTDGDEDGSAPAAHQTDDTSQVTVAGPSATAGPPGTASASPAPGSGLGLLPTMLPVPPPPTAVASTATRIATPAGPRPTGPALVLARTGVDLGSVDSTDSVDLSNTGSAPLTVRVGALPSWLTAVPRASRLDPGYGTQLVITLDRVAAPVGRLDVPIEVTPASGGGGGTIRVTAVVTAGPRILSVTPPSLRAQDCATDGAPATGTLTVEVQDPVGMAGGTVAVTGPDGATATLALSLDSTIDDRSTWTAQLGPSPAGVLGYTVTVKDLNNRVATHEGSLTVATCS
ncbi:hypothetical protein [Frankia nepalensis]|uniref:BACON domain-containing protein n=1 Tax=Frankia nepalensis TaxID=1836974 RepID=A0A937RFZ1_9ACTN|nr:hypothetical protein [Frankia nepalensis]MBL7502371.1 hypothetical protein [Frankia nepalensis]MBL7516247.1 hypothetical protein [Frankia nepalensis]MBL7625673.1 hypothetical protein [Frankia nepalensis]